MTTSEHFETRSKKPHGRGMAQKSLDLIEAMYAAAEAAQPITGRGIGYKLFTAKMIPSMATAEMQRVYRLLKQGRESGTIPWEWIVDETSGKQVGTIPKHTLSVSTAPTNATFGSSNRFVWRFGRKKARFAAS